MATSMSRKHDRGGGGTLRDRAGGGARGAAGLRLGRARPAEYRRGGAAPERRPASGRGRARPVWDRTTVWGMLKNPAYMGQAAFGKTRVGPLQPRLRAQRGGSLQPRRAYSTTDVPRGGVDYHPGASAGERGALCRGARRSWRRTGSRARQGQRGARYLLQGLVLCQHCGYAYYGKAVSSSAAKGKAARLRLLPLHWHRCLPLWRRTDLSQCRRCGPTCSI